MKNVKIITVTGGPSGGKTTLMSTLEKQIAEKFPDWYLMIVPETATELIINGIRPFGNCLSLLRFQKYVLQKQIEKERMYKEVAQELPYDNVLIVCDRGLCDNIAYCDNDECSAEDMFARLLAPHNLTISEARDSYDLVLHLTTAAKGTNCYTTENNKARTETAEEAIELDNKTLNAWIGQPNLKIIDNSTDFSEKITRALNEIYYIMGEKKVEYNKKMLVNLPDISKLNYNRKITIIQNYLHSDNPNIERRIRQRVYGKNSTFYYTEKDNIKKDGSRLKLERKISEREYLSLMTQVDTFYHQIVKERYCFVYENQYMNLDVFPFDDKKGILEISLKEGDTVVDYPDFIEIIKEVTTDDIYKNIEISKNLKL